jgi:hypothetical protein
MSFKRTTFLLFIIILLFVSLFFVFKSIWEKKDKSFDYRFKGPPPGAYPFVKGPTSPPPSPAQKEKK